MVRRPLHHLSFILALSGCFEDIDEFEIDDSTSGTSATTSSSTSSTSSLDGSTSGASTTSTEDDSTADTTSTGVETSSPDPDTMAETTGAESSTGASNPDSASSSSETGPLGPPEFFDDFDRPDSALVGNGWREKDGMAFRLRESSVAAEVVAPRPFFNNTVTRGPVAADLTIEVEFFIETFDEVNHPFLLARVLGSFTSGEPLTGYLMEPQPEDGELCVLRLQGANGFSAVACTAYCDPTQRQCLEAGARYRSRLTVRGSGPVDLLGELERQDNGEWVEVASVVTADTAAAAIVEAGEFGFGGGQNGSQLGNYQFDNFRATFDE